MPRPEYREPTEVEKQFIYEIYEMLFRSHFSLPKKRSMMTAALGYEPWSWRVVGITEEAIRAIARNGFKKPSRVLVRDHTLPRATTYKRIFEERMPFEQWWAWVWTNDYTILMTNDEHNGKKQKSQVYPLNPTDSYFVDTEVAGWHQTIAREGAFIRTLCEEHGISY